MGAITPGHPGCGTTTVKPTAASARRLALQPVISFSAVGSPWLLPLDQDQSRRSMSVSTTRPHAQTARSYHLGPGISYCRNRTMRVNLDIQYPYSILCRRRKEAVVMGNLRFTDIQTRPRGLLDLTRITLDEVRWLVTSFETAFQANRPSGASMGSRVLPPGTRLTRTVRCRCRGSAAVSSGLPEDLFPPSCAGTAVWDGSKHGRSLDSCPLGGLADDASHAGGCPCRSHAAGTGAAAPGRGHEPPRTTTWRPQHPISSGQVWGMVASRRSQVRRQWPGERS